MIAIDLGRNRVANVDPLPPDRGVGSVVPNLAVLDASPRRFATGMITLDAHDTIAAVASPPGPGLRGLVRISGPKAWSVALAEFEPDRAAPRPDRPEVLTGRILLAELGRRLPSLVALWPGPRTYTGQPLAEIHTPGAPPLVQCVLELCLNHGARLAEAGEFTLRAFLNGKLDLTRAEAVLGVIDARDTNQLDAALRQLAGGLAGPIERLRDRLLDVLAHLEAGLDFVDEDDVDPIGRAALCRELDAGSEELSRLASRFRDRDRPETRPRVVLIGPPNAGKSRLFNAMVGEQRAIVSPIAGTTRDYLSAPVVLDGLEVVVVDTAGLEDVDRPIESRRSRCDWLRPTRPTCCWCARPPTTRAFASRGRIAPTCSSRPSATSPRRSPARSPPAP